MLKEFFPKWGKAKLISIGVNVDEYREQPENMNIRKYWGIPNNTRIIISVANLVPVKGIEVLIDAFEGLAPYYPNFYLMIVFNFSTYYAYILKNFIFIFYIFIFKIIFTVIPQNLRYFLFISYNKCQKH